MLFTQKPFFSLALAWAISSADIVWKDENVTKVLLDSETLYSAALCLQGDFNVIATVQFFLSSHICWVNLIAVNVTLVWKFLSARTMQSYCLIPILCFVFISSIDLQTAQSLHSMLHIDDFKFLFGFVLIFQWNRKAQNIKICHELIVRNCLLYREAEWLLITLTDFSFNNINMSPALPICCATRMWFSEQACAKGQSHIFHLWVSHTPFSRTIGS